MTLPIKHQQSYQGLQVARRGIAFFIKRNKNPHNHRRADSVVYLKWQDNSKTEL